MDYRSPRVLDNRASKQRAGLEPCGAWSRLRQRISSCRGGSMRPQRWLGRNARIALALGFTLVLASTSPAAGAITPKSAAGAATTTRDVQPTYAAGNETSCPKGTTTFINTAGLGSGAVSETYSKN